MIPGCHDSKDGNIELLSLKKDIGKKISEPRRKMIFFSRFSLLNKKVLI